MERWRWIVAIGATLAAIPLLAIDNVSSAEGREQAPKTEVLGVTAARADDGLAGMTDRAVAWSAARSAAREQNVTLALQIAANVRAEEQAKAAAEAQAAADAAAAAKAEQAKKDAAARAAAAAAAAKKATTTTAKPVPKTTAAPATTAVKRTGEPTAEQWAKLRSCESGGNYRAVSPSQKFRGAYQFSQGTWDWVAGQVAPQLVGVDPIDAAPGDQDNMALNLYRMRGASQWPVCGRYLQ